MPPTHHVAFLLRVGSAQLQQRNTLWTEADDEMHSEISWTKFPQELKTLKTGTPSSCLFLLLLSRQHSKMEKALWLVFSHIDLQHITSPWEIPSGRTSQPSSSSSTGVSSYLFIIRWMIIFRALFFLRVFNFIMILLYLMFMFGKFLWFFAKSITCDASILAASINSWYTKENLLNMCRYMWTSAMLMYFSCVGSKTEAQLNAFVAVSPFFNENLVQCSQRQCRWSGAWLSQLLVLPLFLHTPANRSASWDHWYIYFLLVHQQMLL